MFLNYYLIISLILDVVILTNVNYEELDIALEDFKKWGNPAGIFLFKIFNSILNGNKVTLVMLVITISLIPFLKLLLVFLFIKCIRDK